MKNDFFERQIKKIDIVGPQPILYVESQAKFQTFLGGVISIFAFILILITGSYFAILTFGRKNYTVVYNEIVTNEANLNISENPFVFLITGSNNQPLDNTYVNLSALYTTLIGMNISELPIQLTSCKEEYLPQDFFSRLMESKFNYLLPFAWCLNPKDINDKLIFGVKGQLQDTAYYRILSARCVNGTDVICRSPEELDRLLNTTTQTILFKDYQMNHNNVYQPGTAYLNYNNIWMNSQFFYSYIFKLRKIVYQSDNGFIYPFIDEKEYHTLEDNYQSIISFDFTKVNTSQMFGSFDVVMSGKKPVYFRTYDKLQTLFANIGGIVKVILMITGVVQQLVIKKLYYLYLTNRLVWNLDNIHQNKENEFCHSQKPSMRNLSFAVNKCQNVKLEQSSMRNITPFKNVENK
jgi:hypothetical protein